MTRSRRLLNKSLFAVLDHGLASGAMFFLNIYFARVTNDIEYGVFACAIAMLFLGLSVSTWFVYGPMMVLGPSEFSDTLKPYLYQARKINLLVAVLLSLAYACLALFARGTRLAAPSLMLCAATPLYLAFQFSRRCAYTVRNPAAAAIGSTGFAAALITLTVWAVRTGRHSAVSALAILAASCFIGLVVFRMTGTLPKTDRGHKPAIQTVLHSHWEYSKWMFLSVFSTYLISSGLIPMLALWQSLAASADLKAAENLFTPFEQSVTALSTLTIPMLASHLHNSGPGKTRRLFWTMLLSALGLSLLYTGAVAAFGSVILDALYGQSLYTHLSSYLAFFMATVSIRAISEMAMSNMLRSLKRTKAFFVASIAVIASILVTAPILTSLYGVAGALLARLITTVLTAILLLASLSYYMRKHND